MIIINYLVCGHEPKVTFKDGFIELDMEKFDVASVMRNFNNNHTEVEIRKVFTGRLAVALDPDNAYQLNLTKR